MSKEAKITVSRDEIIVLQNHEFFEKKRIITGKIYQQFADIVQDANTSSIFSGGFFPAGTDLTTGKISKGENYLGLPFMVLDFPRFFNTHQIVAVRTMVWWANFISSTFLVSGDRMPGVKKAVLKNLDLLKESETWICISDSPWNHHFQKDNYVLIRELEREETMKILEAGNFIKLARKISIRQINALCPFAKESFKLYALLFS